MLKKLGFKRFFSKIGPGFITGAADDDPSGIATYAQTGAVFGYQQLWLTLFSFPFMTVVQEMCGRIGMVTGKGLSGVMRSRFSKLFVFGTVLLLFIANVVNIGADLGAMASSVALFGGSFWVWIVLFTVVIIFLQIKIPYPKYAKVLKYLTLTLFAYVITLFLAHADWKAITMSTIFPQFFFSKEFILNIVAFLGTTISPYLFFWQSDEEVEEEVVSGKIRSMGKGVPRVSKADIKDMRRDTVIGMFFSNLVSFFIIATTAATLHVNGIFDIQTADQAAEALRPFAGQFAFLLFALGIIGTGLLAIPVLAGSASYAAAEAFGWKEGLGKRFKQAKGFYFVIILATVLGLLVNLLPIPSFQMLYYAAIINGVCSPPLLFVILLLANDKKIMGKEVNSPAENAAGILITFFMTISVLLLFYFLIF